ncbi:MAG: hypothetical protein IH956_04580 [Chloroflexi bacterium]|nr:hypothetical protein [Chloroflexota bacterium]
MLLTGPALEKAKVLAHHSEPGDPVLLEWVRHRIDDLVRLEPWAIVVILGLLIVAIPVMVMAVFLLRRPRRGRP